MDLRRIAFRIATDEFPKRIQIKSPHWAPGPPWPAGQGYEEWDERHGWHSESKYGKLTPELLEKHPNLGECLDCPDPNVELIDTEELLVTVTEQAHELIEGTGCTRSPDDPAHDPDTMWIDCPNQESYDKLINLFESSRFRAKHDDVYWWLWTTWRDAKITEVPLSQKDYEAEHFLRSRDVKPPGWVPELKAIPGGRESFDLRGVASRVANGPHRGNHN